MAQVVEGRGGEGRGLLWSKLETSEAAQSQGFGRDHRGRLCSAALLPGKPLAGAPSVSFEVPGLSPWARLTVLSAFPSWAWQAFAWLLHSFHSVGQAPLGWREPKWHP